MEIESGEPTVAVQLAVDEPAAPVESESRQEEHNGEGCSAAVLNSEQESISQNHVQVELPYQDHDYIGTNKAKSSEKLTKTDQRFPTIQGLGDYLADGQLNNGVTNRWRLRRPVQTNVHNNVAVANVQGPPQLQRIVPMHGGIFTNATGTPVVGMGSQPMSAGRRHFALTGPMQQMTPTVALNARRVIQPGPNEPPVLFQGALGQATARMIPSRSAPQQRRQIISPRTQMANDPALVAARHAPAPFLTPARGPVGRGGGAKASAQHRSANEGAQLMDPTIDYHPVSAQARPLASSGGRPASSQKDLSLIDMLAEEEAQNEQFFQRQSKMGGGNRKSAATAVAAGAVPPASKESELDSYPAVHPATVPPPGRVSIPGSQKPAQMEGTRAEQQQRIRGRSNIPTELSSILQLSPPSDRLSTTRESSEAALEVAYAYVKQKQQEQAEKSPGKRAGSQLLTSPPQAGYSGTGGQQRHMFVPMTTSPAARRAFQHRSSLEGLAEVAQLSQQQQHQILMSGAPLNTQGRASMSASPQKLGTVLMPPGSQYAMDASQPPHLLPQRAQPLQSYPQQIVPGAYNALPAASTQYVVTSQLPPHHALVYTAMGAEQAPLQQQQPMPSDQESGPAITTRRQPKRTGSAGKNLQNLMKKGRTKPQVSAAVDWPEGEEYITRCICGMTHEDAFMIECDRCNVWQHVVCMGVDPIPETYFCEQCNPRPLKYNSEQARDIQQKQLERLKGAGKGATRKEIKKGKAIGTSNKVATTAKTAEVPQNQMSRGMRAFLSAHPEEIERTSKATDVLLKELREEGVKAKQMYVAPDVEGLVATTILEEGQPLIEYTGYFSLASDVGAKADQKMPHKQFLLIYKGLPEPVAIDSTKIGTSARFARRSCKPNTEILHVSENGGLHLILTANQRIDFSAEVTIPFDFDFTQSPVPVSCACSINDDQIEGECPVRDFNKRLGSENSAKVARVPAGVMSAEKAKPSNAEVLQSPQNRESVKKPLPPTKTSPKTKKGVAKKAKGKKMLGKKKPQPVIGKVKRGRPPNGNAEDVSTAKRRSLRAQAIDGGEDRPTRGSAEAPVVGPGTSEAADNKDRAGESSSTLRGRKVKTEPELPASPENVKLDREQRKLQDAIAQIERQSQIEIRKQEKKSPQKKAEEESKDSTSKAAAVKAKEAKKDKKLPQKTAKGGHLKIPFKLPYSKRTSTAAAIKTEERSVSPPPSRRVSLKRAATTAAAVKHEEAPQSPQRKRKAAKESMSNAEAAQLLTEMASGGNGHHETSTSSSANLYGLESTQDIREQYVQLAEVAMRSGGPGGCDFSLTPDYPKVSASSIRLPAFVAREEVQSAATPSTADVAASSAAAITTNAVAVPKSTPGKPIIANTKAVKKLTIDEYKKRRKTASLESPAEVLATTTPSINPSTGRPSFFPSLNSPVLLSLPQTVGSGAVKQQASAPMAHGGMAMGASSSSSSSTNTAPDAVAAPEPEVVTSSSAPSIDELRKRICGEAGAGKEKARPTPTSAPTQATTSQEARGSPVEGDGDIDDEPKISLDDRLRTQFGLLPKAKKDVPGAGAAVPLPQQQQQSQPASCSSSRQSLRQQTVYRQNIPPPGLVNPNHFGGFPIPPPTPPSTPEQPPARRFPGDPR